MKIITTEPDQVGGIEYRLIECNITDDYIFINATYHAIINIGGSQYDLIWQNGQSYYDNDCSMLSNEFYLNSEGGCSKVMEDIGYIDVNQFNEVEAMELNRTYHEYFTSQQYLKIKKVLDEKRPRFDDIFSSKPKDYDIEYIKGEQGAHGPYSIVTPKR